MSLAMTWSGSRTPTCAKAWILVLMSPLATWEMTKLMVEAVLLWMSSKWGETERILKTHTIHFSISEAKILSCNTFNRNKISTVLNSYLRSGIMTGSRTSSSLCCTRSGISLAHVWLFSNTSRSSWNSFGMDGVDCSKWAFCARAWLLKME